MLTTSYVSPAMRALEPRVKEAGIRILNESGLDPGIDHMSAMRVIHGVEKRDGKIYQLSTDHRRSAGLTIRATILFDINSSWSPQVKLAGVKKRLCKMAREWRDCRGAGRKAV